MVPLVEVSSLLAVRGGVRLRLRGRVVWEGLVSGFREVGLRVDARAVRRWLRFLGVKAGRRLKRVVVYSRSGEVHVDVASRMRPDEVELLGLAPHARDLVYAFACLTLACLAAGVDPRFLAVLVSLMEVVVV